MDAEIVLLRVTLTVVFAATSVIGEVNETVGVLASFCEKVILFVTFNKFVNEKVYDLV